MSQIQRDDDTEGSTTELLRTVRRAVEKPDTWPSTHMVGSGGPPELAEIVEEIESLEPHDRVVVLIGIDGDDLEVMYLDREAAERGVTVLEAMTKDIGNGRSDAFGFAVRYYELDEVTADLLTGMFGDGDTDREEDDGDEVEPEEGDGHDDQEDDDDGTDLPEFDEEADDEEDGEDLDEDDVDDGDLDDEDGEFDEEEDEPEEGDPGADTDGEETAVVARVEIWRSKVRTGRAA